MTVDVAPEVLISAAELDERVRALGAEIARDYAGRRPLVVCILKGAFVFTSDLVRAADLDLEIDFMAISSYGTGTKTSGVVRIVRDLDEPIDGRDVIVVEDILDSGLTLAYLLRSLDARGPASVAVCTLLRKDVARRVDIPVRYVGFDIPDRFVVGYGLDHAERYRNLPYVGGVV